MSDIIEFKDFEKVDLRVGKVLSAVKHPKADKLLVLSVDLGEPAPRQIVAGIALRFTPEQMVGTNIIIVANLEPRTLRGVESHGMLLAAGGDESFSLLTAGSAPGSKVG